MAKAGRYASKAHKHEFKAFLARFQNSSKADIQAKKRVRKYSRIKALLKRGIAEPIHTDRQRRSGI